MPRRTLQKQIEDYQNGIAFDGPEPEESPIPQDYSPVPQTSAPELPTLPRVGVSPDLNTSQMNAPVNRPKLSDIIQGQLDQMNQRPTLKQTLLRSGLQAGTIGLAGLLGGTQGAYGATEGIDQQNTQRIAQGTERRKELQTQLEAEKNREERTTLNTATTQEKAREADLRQKEIEGQNAERLEGIKQTNETRTEIQNLKNLIAQGGVNQKNSKLEADMLKAGFKKNENGQFEEDVNSSAAKDRAALQNLRDAQGDVAKARAEALRNPDPNSPAAQRLKVAEGNLAMRQKEFEIHAFGTVGGVQPAGGLQTEGGQPVGTLFQGNVKPTGTQRDAAGRADTMLDLDKRIRTALQNPQIKAGTGPLVGRLNEIENRAGVLPHDLAELKNDLVSYGAFQAGMHPVRGIGALEYFDKVMGGLGQTPESLLGKLDSNKATAESVKKTGTVNTAKPSLPGKVIKYDNKGNRIE